MDISQFKIFERKKDYKRLVSEWYYKTFARGLWRDYNILIHKYNQNQILWGDLMDKNDRTGA